MMTAVCVLCFRRKVHFSMQSCCQVAELPHTQFLQWRFHQATKKEHNSKFQWYFVTCIRYFWKKKYVVSIQTSQCHFSILQGKLKSLSNVFVLYHFVIITMSCACRLRACMFVVAESFICKRTSFWKPVIGIHSIRDKLFIKVVCQTNQWIFIFYFTRCW